MLFENSSALVHCHVLLRVHGLEEGLGRRVLGKGEHGEAALLVLGRGRRTRTLAARPRPGCGWRRRWRRSGETTFLRHSYGHARTWRTRPPLPASPSPGRGRRPRAGGVDQEGLRPAGGDAAGDEEEVGGGVDLGSDVDARRPDARARHLERGEGGREGREGRDAGRGEGEGSREGKAGRPLRGHVDRSSNVETVEWATSQSGSASQKTLQRRSKGTVDAPTSWAERREATSSVIPGRSGRPCTPPRCSSGTRRTARSRPAPARRSGRRRGGSCSPSPRPDAASRARRGTGR